MQAKATRMIKIFLVLILSFLLSSCSEKKNLLDDKYDVVIAALQEQLSDNYTGKIMGSDTLIFNDFKLDPNPVGNFKIDTSGSEITFAFNTWQSTGAKYDKYFNSGDIDFLFQQVNSPGLNSWDKSRIQDVSFVDSSYPTVDSLRTPITETWYVFRDSTYNYLSLSEPIFNLERDKSLIGLSIYLRDYYIQRLFEFDLDKNQKWNVTSKHNLVFKIILLDETDTEFEITTIYLNGYTE
jgi:hypothetical protein